MGRLNLLGGQINLLGGQMPTQLTLFTSLKKYIGNTKEELLAFFWTNNVQSILVNFTMIYTLRCFSSEMNKQIHHKSQYTYIFSYTELQKF